MLHGVSLASVLSVDVLATGPYARVLERLGDNSALILQTVSDCWKAT